MKPTDIKNPENFHKVVDCQWACPAHTDVPEYIRLIAQGRFTDAYLVNRESNVSPGILGRVCVIVLANLRADAAALKTNPSPSAD